MLKIFRQSDRIGRRRSLFLSAALLLVSVLPLFLWLKADPDLSTLIIVQCIVCLLVASFVGVANRRLGHRHSIENVAKWHGRTAIQHHAEHFKG